jgi:hypothetical protein
MNVVTRGIVILLALALACLVGWRVVVTGMAHLNVDDDPERALAWDPHQPDALLARAEHQLSSHQPLASCCVASRCKRRRSGSSVPPLMPNTTPSTHGSFTV